MDRLTYRTSTPGAGLDHVVSVHGDDGRVHPGPSCARAEPGATWFDCSCALRCRLRCGLIITK